MTWILIILGLLFGLSSSGLSGAMFGALLGYLFGRVIALGDEVRALRNAVDTLRGPSPLTEAGPTEPAPISETADEVPWPAPTDATTPPEPAATWPSPAPQPASAWTPPASVREEARTPLLDRLPGPLRDFITEGNLVVKVGVVVLFFGLAFLLKYAAARIAFPIELRLALVGAGGLALLALGWRLRERRRGYALALQGGGIGVLYLTLYAAFRLYGLLPAEATFPLMLAVVVLAAWLAILQDARSLAALGVMGGFLAPVLTASESGRHVELFGYYALLNLGILLIAWRKAWRELNLLGFLFTFVIGTAWGVLRYRPQDFATTEPFLILFFLIFLASAVLYALRRAPDARDYVHASMVFGPPLVGFGLQAGLVHEFEYGLAWSAFALGGLYLLLASALWRRAGENLRQLTEAFLALGVIFASLAIPFAVDGRWSSAAWALEGAGILWVGLRQGRRFAVGFGLLLQLGAGLLYLADAHPMPAALPLLNTDFLGTAMIGLAGLFSAYQLRAADSPRPEGASSMEAGRVGGDGPAQRASPDGEPEGGRPGMGGIRMASPMLLLWGLAWWLLGGQADLARNLPGHDLIAAMLAYVALGAAAARLAAERYAWTALHHVPAGYLALLALLAFASSLIQPHPAAHGGGWAWPLAFAVMAVMLWWNDRRNWAFSAPGLTHAGTLWLLALLVARELDWRIGMAIGQDGMVRGSWSEIAWGLIPAVMLAWIGAWRRWPVATHERAYRGLAGGGLALYLILWVVIVNLDSSGDPWPLPYLPLLNPLDVAIGLVLLVLARAGLAHRELRPAMPARRLLPVAGGVLFLWLNAILARSLHHYADLPLDLSAMVPSTLAQATFSIAWAITGLVLMVVATRIQRRALWMVAAALLAVVVVKLFLFDLSGRDTLERIASFVGVGLLLLLAGYLSPMPPGREKSPSENAP
ncbi:MAG: DUF2339 domain-containing protein [Halothiobacillaceae bacterium]|nr:MAG: DUF2339 domain-containing protein [Halothiobacillaceae bacterium]